MRRRQKASTLIELLVASLIATVGVVGLFSLYTYCMQVVQNQRITSVATQIARADVEEAKVLGYDNLPLGTLDGSRSVGNWTGAIEYYDVAGKQLAGTTDAFYSLQRTISDYNMTLSGSSYTLSDIGKRVVKVSVKRYPSNVEVMVMGTTIAKGGL